MVQVGGHVYTARRTIAALKPVSCEQCGGRYYYVMRRTVQGKGSAVYGLGGGAAAGRALAAADFAVRQTLFQDADLVPCPDCHWIQRDMTKAEAARRYRRLGTAGFLLGCGAVVCLVAAPLNYAQPYNKKAMGFIAVLFGVGVVAAVGCGACFVLQRALRGRLNFNAAHPAPPALPPTKEPPVVPLRLVPPANPDDPAAVFTLAAVGITDGDGTTLRLPNERPVRRLFGLDGRSPEPLLIDPGTADFPSARALYV